MALHTVLRHTARGEVSLGQSPIPVPGEHEVRIKTVAVALNPLDWKIVYNSDAQPPTAIGCDFSGTVERLGSSVRSDIKVGDRVAGMIHGGNSWWPDDGAFAEYVVVPAHIVLHLPSHISFEDGATLCTPVYTGALALYHSLDLALPLSSGEQTDGIPVLIYGGATATGAMEIQLAKLSGCKVIAVCSSDSFEFAEKCGADAVFDYRDPACGDLIRVLTEKNLRHVVDCISNEQSAAICTAAMAPKGGGAYISCTHTGPSIPTPGIVTRKLMAFTSLGKESPFIAQSVTIQSDKAFAKDFALLAEKLLTERQLSPHNIEVRANGLNGISDGLRDLMEGKVRRKRLVYRIQDTIGT